MPQDAAPCSVSKLFASYFSVSKQVNAQSSVSKQCATQVSVSEQGAASCSVSQQDAAQRSVFKQGEAQLICAHRYISQVTQLYVFCHCKTSTHWESVSRQILYSGHKSLMMAGSDFVSELSRASFRIL